MRLAGDIERDLIVGDGAPSNARDNGDGATLFTRGSRDHDGELLRHVFGSFLLRSGPYLQPRLEQRSKGRSHIDEYHDP